MNERYERDRTRSYMVISECTFLQYYQKEALFISGKKIILVLANVSRKKSYLKIIYFKIKNKSNANVASIFLIRGSQRSQGVLREVNNSDDRWVGQITI